MALHEDTHEPYKDAVTVFENGSVTIKAYKEKYGYSYRKTIRDALEGMQKIMNNKE